MGFYVKNRYIKSGSKSTVVPGGPTETRPEAPFPGQLRYNTDLCKLEYYTGYTFRVVAAEGRTEISVDSFAGDGVSTSYGPLSTAPGSPTACLVFVGGVYQIPTDSYTVAGTTIIFSGPVPTALPINVVHGIGSTVTEGCVIPLHVETPVPIYPSAADTIDFNEGP